MLMYFYQLFGTTAHNSLGSSPYANISIEVVGFADGTDQVADSTLIGLYCGTHVDVVLMVVYTSYLMY
jgi:hypothetical protein